MAKLLKAQKEQIKVLSAELVDLAVSEGKVDFGIFPDGYDHTNIGDLVVSNNERVLEIYSTIEAILVDFGKSLDRGEVRIDSHSSSAPFVELDYFTDTEYVMEAAVDQALTSYGYRHFN